MGYFIIAVMILLASIKYGCSILFFLKNFFHSDGGSSEP